MTKIMVDIETLGSKPGAVILSIGAVLFDPWRPLIGDDPDDVIIDRFETIVDIEEEGSSVLTIDRSTVAWWLQATPEMEAARLALDVPKDQKASLSGALASFSYWLRSQEPIYLSGWEAAVLSLEQSSRSGPSYISDWPPFGRSLPEQFTEEVWAWPPSFDMALLGEALDRLHYPRPWKRRMERDARTVCAIAGLSKDDESAPKASTRHRALDDAEAQAILLSRALRQMGEREK